MKMNTRHADLNHFLSDQSSADAVFRDFHVHVSRSSVDSYRHQLRFMFKPEKIQVVSEEQRIARLQFCYDWASRSLPTSAGNRWRDLTIPTKNREDLNAPRRESDSGPILRF
jgi:hypothetical protein